jgi:hypothetical protein
MEDWISLKPIKGTKNKKDLQGRLGRIYIELYNCPCIIGDELSVSAKRSIEPKTRTRASIDVNESMMHSRDLFVCLSMSNQRRQKQYYATGFSGSLCPRLL